MEAFVKNMEDDIAGHIVFLDPIASVDTKFAINLLKPLPNI